MPDKIRKIVFMFKKFKKDIFRDRDIYLLAEDLHSEELGDYYFIMTEEQMLSGHSQQYSFDQEGIPIIPTYIDVAEKKMIYYPISIGQYGLAIWHTYQGNALTKDLDRFLKIAQWFYENRIEDDALGCYWLTDVEKPAYHMFQPWKSAFSQARAINILLRAWQVTAKQEYKRVAECALFPFLHSVSDGGVTTPTDFGPFYEEYPAEEATLVLNGMIFSLCGIYDFIRVDREHRVATKIFNEGVQTLTKVLTHYDMGFWSKYSLCEAPYHPKIDPSTIGYHYLHIVQLKLLYRLTNKEIFKTFSDRWSKYVNWKNIMRMYFIKYQALRKMKRL